MAKKKKRNPFAAINRARKAAKPKSKRKRSKPKTRRKAQPKKATSRKTMARKKSGGKRRSTRRRSSGGNTAIMSVVKAVGLGVGGAVLGGVVSRAASGVVPSPTMRGLGVVALAAVSAGFLGAGFLPVAVGMGIRGGLTAAQNLLPGITGLGEEQQLAQLSQEEVDELTFALLNEGVGADEHYQDALIGYDDRNAPLVGDEGAALESQAFDEFQEG